MPSKIDLLSELDAHNEYFDSLVNMIPAKLYVAGASGDDKYNPKYLKGQHKESKEARKARNKLAKSAKFDPEKMENTLEAKKRVQREQEEMSDSDNDEDIEMSDNDDGEQEEEGDLPQLDTSKSKDSSETVEEKSYASRIEMLRAKLHKKMAEKAPNASTPAPALVSKRAARRAEKRKRQEAAKQRNNKKATSMAEKKVETTRH